MAWCNSWKVFVSLLLCFIVVDEVQCRPCWDANILNMKASVATTDLGSCNMKDDFGPNSTCFQMMNDADATPTNPPASGQVVLVLGCGKCTADTVTTKQDVKLKCNAASGAMCSGNCNFADAPNGFAKLIATTVDNMHKCNAYPPVDYTGDKMVCGSADQCAWVKYKVTKAGGITHYAGCKSICEALPKEETVGSCTSCNGKEAAYCNKADLTTTKAPETTVAPKGGSSAPGGSSASGGSGGVASARLGSVIAAVGAVAIFARVH